MNGAKTPLGWIIGILLLFIGILWLSSNIFYGIVCILVSILIIPITQSIFEKVKKTKVPNYVGWLSMIFGIFLMFNSLYLIFKTTQSNAEQNLKLANKYIDEGNLDTVPYFIAKAKLFSNKKAVELEKELINYKDSSYVRNILAEMSDDDYNLLINKDLKKKYLNHSTLNQLLYDRLYEISPNRKKIVEQVQEEKERVRIAAEKERERQQKIKEQQERKKLIEAQFSPWDGSHLELTKLIKKSMNDPDSYEHIETRFKDENEYIFIITEFRGKNAFGGKVINSVSAKADVNGNIIEIIK
ncbi:hypothetical protein [Psychroflexus planctonicus]|uniref:hypothetical protein n=1 Tax=Psychroflexus planctonicus TaxID=1526575 RepID=UPI0016674673|nr:hypothetical protein [Psychroflexus planctonicus]